MNERALASLCCSLLALSSLSASAENGCPPGQSPSNLSAPLGSAESMNSCMPLPQDVTPRPTWQTRWGAIAADTQGTYGTSADQRTEKQARKAALTACGDRGGTDCNVSLTYANQCVSIAISDKKSSAARAPDLPTAERDSLARCRDGSGGAQCSIYYSACSLPARSR